MTEAYTRRKKVFVLYEKGLSGYKDFSQFRDFDGIQAKIPDAFLRNDDIFSRDPALLMGNLKSSYEFFKKFIYNVLDGIHGDYTEEDKLIPDKELFKKILTNLDEYHAGFSKIPENTRKVIKDRILAYLSAINDKINSNSDKLIAQVVNFTSIEYQSLLLDLAFIIDMFQYTSEGYDVLFMCGNMHRIHITEILLLTEFKPTTQNLFTVYPSQINIDIEAVAKYNIKTHAEFKDMNEIANWLSVVNEACNSSNSDCKVSGGIFMINFDYAIIIVLALLMVLCVCLMLDYWPCNFKFNDLLTKKNSHLCQSKFDKYI